MDKKGLSGKISNGGSQVVKAIYPSKSTKGGNVTKGEDLRTGK